VEAIETTCSGAEEGLIGLVTLKMDVALAGIFPAKLSPIDVAYYGAISKNEIAWIYLQMFGIKFDKWRVFLFSSFTKYYTDHIYFNN